MYSKIEVMKQDEILAILVRHYERPDFDITLAAEEISRRIESLNKYKDLAQELSDRLNEGRSYVMSTDFGRMSVENILESFGFGRNGLQN